MISKNVLCLILVIICFGICDASWLYSSDVNNTNRIEIKTVRFVHSAKLIPNDYLLLPISSDPKEFDSCNLKNIPPYPNGSVIFGAAYGGCDFSRHVLLAQEKFNASAMILVSAAPDISCLPTNGDFSKIKIPLFLIDEQTTLTIFKVLIENSQQKLLTFISLRESRNDYLKITKNGGFYFFQALLILFVVFCFVLCVIGLYQSFKKSRNPFTVQKTCLIFNLIYQIFLFLSLLDPWGVHSYLSFNFLFTTILLSSPPVFSSLSLITFFLNELLIQKKMIEPKLDKFKYPFLLVSFVLWGTYISFAITVGIDLPLIKLGRALGIMTLIFVFFMFVYFVSIGVIISKKLLTFESKKMKKVFPLVVLQSFGILLLLGFATLYVALQYIKIYYTKLNFASWLLYCVGTLLISFTQILIFRPQANYSKNSTDKYKNFDSEKKEKSSTNTK